MFPRLPTVTKALLIANAILFLLQQPFLLGMQTFEPFMLQPLQQGFDAFSPGGNFQPWQLLTYGFLHGSFGHLFFNMLAVFMFGAPLEQTWGEKRFLLYYLVCVAGAGVCQLLVGTLLENPATVLGASGGVFGLLLAYGIGMTVAAAPLMRYTDATAAQLLQPSEYVQQLRATTPEIRQP